MFASNSRGATIRSPCRAVPTVVFLIMAGCFAVACSPSLLPVVSGQTTRLPEGFAGNLVFGPYEHQDWWETFNDPALDRIVGAVLASNLDLAEAVARVDQAKARARIAKTVGTLSIQPSVDIDHVNVPTNASLGKELGELEGEINVTLPDRFELTTSSFAASFAYEVDFWDRALNEARAAGAESLASEWDYRAARIGVVAETVHTYLEIAYLRRQQGLVEEIVEIFQQREKLATARYSRGLSSAHDLYMARQDLWDAKAELPAIEGSLADAEGRLWVLLGGYRADLASMLPDSLSPLAVLEPVPVGIPADLLEQRPDVSAARQRMEAARYAVGARRAELLPSLSLSGSIGLQSSDFNNLFDPTQWFRNLTANFLGPVFQGTRLRDNVALAETRWKETVAAYGRSVVTAVNEVEISLAGLEATRRSYSLRASFVEEARAEEAFQERRYRSGVGNYEDFLAASQALANANAALAVAERDLGYARLALHRALAGGWAPPESVAGQPDRTARVADLQAVPFSTE